MNRSATVSFSISIPFFPILNCCSVTHFLQDKCLREAFRSNNGKHWKVIAAMVNVYSDDVVAAFTREPFERSTKKRGELEVRYRNVCLVYKFFILIRITHRNSSIHLYWPTCFRLKASVGRVLKSVGHRNLYSVFVVCFRLLCTNVLGSRSVLLFHPVSDMSVYIDFDACLTHVRYIMSVCERGTVSCGRRCARTLERTGMVSPRWSTRVVKLPCTVSIDGERCSILRFSKGRGRKKCVVACSAV